MDRSNEDLDAVNVRLLAENAELKEELVDAVKDRAELHKWMDDEQELRATRQKDIDSLRDTAAKYRELLDAFNAAMGSEYRTDDAAHDGILAAIGDCGVCMMKTGPVAREILGKLVAHHEFTDEPQLDSETWAAWRLDTPITWGDLRALKREMEGKRE
jgi:hypothetical protein